jgi:sugar phosphate isomerase/epimerase
VSFLTEGLNGRIRHWDVKGPRGVVRFELAEALGLEVASVYVHALAGEGEPDGPCSTSGADDCWHDALASSLANATLKAYRDCGQEAAIFADLADYYDLLPDVTS